MWYVYAIKSETDSTIYVGMSQNINERLNNHNSKKVTATKSHTPYKLIYVEAQEDRAKAREREKYFKGGSGKEILKNIYI